MKNPEGNQKREDLLPFKNLSPLPEADYLKEINSSTVNLVSREVGEWHFTGRSVEEVLSTAQKSKTAFDNLKDNYGVPVNVHVVLAENEDGQASAYLLTDKIEGQDLYPANSKEMNWLDDLSKADKQRFIDELDQLLSSLALYALDNIKKDGFLWDISKISQYVWGKKVNENGAVENESHLYLIDIDPDISEGEKDNNSYLTRLVDSLNSYEGRLKVRLEKGRAGINKLREAGVINS